MTITMTYPMVQGSVPGYGEMPAALMIICPALPMRAKDTSLPATLESMAFFKQLRVKSGLPLYITNVVKQKRPSNKNLLVKDIQEGLPILVSEIMTVRPKRIMLMGKCVAKLMLPHFESLTADHGGLFRLNLNSETILQRLQEDMRAPADWPEIVAMPTFSLSDVKRDPTRVPMLNRDLERFLSLPDPTSPPFTNVPDISQIDIPKDKLISVDIETDGLVVESEIKKVGVGWFNGSQEIGSEHIYVTDNPGPEHLRDLVQKINEQNSRMLMHNGQFDLSLIKYNIEKNGLKMPRPLHRLQDTMLKAHMSGIKVKNLKHLASMYTDLPGPHTGGSWEDDEYLAEDVRSTLHVNLKPEVNKANNTYAEDLFHDLVPIIVAMRTRGVYIDRDMLVDINRQKTQELTELNDTLLQVCPESEGINWNASAQVSELLVKMGVPLTAKTKTGNYSVAEEFILEVRNKMSEEPERYEKQLEVTGLMLKRAETNKLVTSFCSSYLELVDSNWMLHPTFKLTGADTGRISSAIPNLQQVPREGPIKRIFIPRPGFDYYAISDLDGAELKSAALASQDEEMASIIVASDFHSEMAKLAFPDIIPQDADVKTIKSEYAAQRKATKTIVFSCLYGGSPANAARKKGLPPENGYAVEAALKQACPTLMNWMEKIKYESVRTLTTDTTFGNLRGLFEKFVYEGKGGVQRAAMNTPIQGTAGITMLAIWRFVYQELRRRKMRSTIIMGIHDSIVLELMKEEEQEWAEVMQLGFQDLWNSPLAENPAFNILPVEGGAEVGLSWASVEETSDYTDILRAYSFSSHNQTYEQVR